MNRPIPIAVVAALACSSAAWTGAAHADSRADWLTARQTEFAAWQGAHPGAEARFADLTAKTAAMVEAWRDRTRASPDSGPAPVLLNVSDDVAELWDGPDTPRMVVVPAGAFTMGSPSSEPGRRDEEGPQHRVTIGYALAVSTYPVRRDEYAAFVADTRRPEPASCVTLQAGDFRDTPGGGRRDPDFGPSGRDPAECISFEEATAYAAWLSRKTGHPYRLLSEAEYEWAERGGTTSAYWWGDDAASACGAANGGDQELKPHVPSSWVVNTCHDGFAFASPVGSFRPNPFGLYDMSGNVWSWTADCYADSYDGAPADGSARAGGLCARRTLRGGSWLNDPAYLRSAIRYRAFTTCQIALNGFRVARTV